MPMIGSIIGAGASILGGIMGSRDASDDRESAEEQALLSRQHQDKWNQLELDEARRQFDALQTQHIQNRVRDAKAAGLHPLYALGASAGGGVMPGFSAGGLGYSPPSGSGMGDSIANIGSQVGGVVDAYVNRKHDKTMRSLSENQARANIRMANARASADEAEASLSASRLKRAEQSANEVRTYPLPGETEITRRQLENPAGQSRMHRDITYRRPDGSLGTNYNPELGLDEIGQARVIYNDLLHWIRMNVEPHLRGAD